MCSSLGVQHTAFCLEGILNDSVGMCGQMEGSYPFLIHQWWCNEHPPFLPIPKLGMQCHTAFLVLNAIVSFGIKVGERGRTFERCGGGLLPGATTVVFSFGASPGRDDGGRFQVATASLLAAVLAE